MKQGSHVFLVDGSGYIFRAYHALPPLTRKSDGLPCGAVSGFCNMLWKLVCEAKDEQHKHLAVPTHFAVVFDYSSKTFRKNIYPGYKANRPAPPEDLIPQFGLIRAATRAFNLPCIEMEGYEADDILATYARMAEKAGADVTIISSDKDLMQLVGPHIRLYDTMKDKATGIAEVEEKWGIPPAMMVDFQALTGDSVDNVPGVAGIGPKTAAELLQNFGSLEAILARAGEISQKKRRETLIENADKARLSRQLVELCTTVPVEPDLSALALLPPDGAKLIGFLKAMEFNNLTRRVAKELDMDAAAIEPDFLEVEWDKSAAHGPDMREAAASAGTVELPLAETAGGGRAAAEDSLIPYDRPVTPQALAAYKKERAKETKIDRSAYKTLLKEEELRQWLLEADRQGFMAFDTETDSLDPLKAELVGFSIACAPGKAAYVPLTHISGERDLLGDAPLQLEQMEKAKALALLKPVLENEAVLKIGQNIKYDMQIMARQGIGLRSFDDTMLISYVLDAGAVNSHGLDALAAAWLNHRTIEYSDIVGKEKKSSFAQVALDKATEYAAEDADVTLRLWQVLKPQLIARGVGAAARVKNHSARSAGNMCGLARIYEREERPLVAVLAEMEKRGILVDKGILARLSGDFSREAEKIAQEIYALAGEEFNIGSPKQLGEILFGKFGLPEGRKTKTGQWSTSAQTLDDLAVRRDLAEAGGALAQGQKLAGKIAAWRQLKKLQSTYTDALPGFCDEQGRVRTHYAQAATTTGRLASSEPNLQNIPVRTKEGRLIRTAFIAPAGRLLLSADYSQIELRVLAHVADIAALKNAFAENIDIHAMTASEMFNVPLAAMTAEIRRRAKAINFGIIYGISAFGLANQLGIGREEAGQYIKTYFERFPGIKEYMENTKAFAREHGYVETIFGRRAHYPQINSSNPQIRAFNERAAINAPIQGAAADIIRRAMIRMNDGLREAGLIADGLTCGRLREKQAGPLAHNSWAGGVVTASGCADNGVGGLDRLACGDVREKEARLYGESGAAAANGRAQDTARRVGVPMRTEDKVQMLLQVHDELVFEVAEEAIEETIPVVREIMENAAFPAVNLSVPLKVEARAAKNWDEAH